MSERINGQMDQFRRCLDEAALSEEQYGQLPLRLAAAERRARAAEAFVDRLPQAVLRVDARGRVLYANDLAMLLLRRGDGLAYGAGQRLRAEYADDAAKLQASIARAAQGSGGICLSLRRRSGAAALQVCLTPPGADELPEGAVLLTLHDPAWPAPAPVPALMQMYQLSESEARVAAALAEGHCVQDIADQHKVKVSTVRTQVKNALEKAGVRRQAELVAVVSRLPLLRPPAAASAPAPAVSVVPWRCAPSGAAETVFQPSV